MLGFLKTDYSFAIKSMCKNRHFPDYRLDLPYTLKEREKAVN